MKSIKKGSITVKGTMQYLGRTYDIIRFGVRLRIVDQRTDRSLDAKGYFDANEIREAYPDAYVSV